MNGQFTTCDEFCRSVYAVLDSNLKKSWKPDDNRVVRAAAEAMKFCCIGHFGLAVWRLNTLRTPVKSRLLYRVNELVIRSDSHLEQQDEASICYC